MSENNHEELFKTTLMGGFDKDDVMTKVQNLKDQAYAAQKKLEAKIEEKEQEIEKLNRRIREREDKIEELEKNIHEKYQSYIDNYDSISGLVFEAQVKAKKLTQETEDACRGVTCIQKNESPISMNIIASHCPSESTEHSLILVTMACKI